MFGLTALGAVHTAIALVAVVCGFVMTIRDKRIGTDLPLGWTYVSCTVVACLTAFGIFRHGGFGAPHALAALTLVAIAMSLAAGRHRRSSRLAPYIETLGYSATLLFHMIPATVETFSRLPVGAPLFNGPDDPRVQPVLGVYVLAYLLLAAVQARSIWRATRGVRRVSFT